MWVRYSDVVVSNEVDRDGGDTSGYVPEGAVARPYTGQLPARVAIGGLIACCVVDVLQIGVSLMIRASLQDGAYFDEHGMWSQLRAWELRSFLIFAPLVALLFTAVPFLMWFSRAHAYASAKAPLIKGDPVLVWFIPLANLWMPFQRLRDVWKVITHEPGTIVVAWWFFWVARAFVARATWTEVDTVESMLDLQMLIVLAALVDVVAAFLAARIVIRIDAAARGRSPTTF